MLYENKGENIAGFTPVGCLEEAEAFKETLLSGWREKGPKVAKFEKDYQKWLERNTQLVSLVLLQVMILY